MLEQATRSFRLVHERARTLKELFVRRSAAAGRASVHALDDVRPARRARRGRRAWWAATAPARPRTLRCLAGIVPLDSGRAECGGRVVSLLELGAGFGPDFTGRENI